MIQSNRTFTCAACSKPVIMKIATSPDPEAPEMINCPPDTYLGYIVDHGVNINPIVIVVCSLNCLSKLLSL